MRDLVALKKVSLSLSQPNKSHSMNSSQFYPWISPSSLTSFNQSQVLQSSEMAVPNAWAITAHSSAIPIHGLRLSSELSPPARIRNSVSVSFAGKVVWSVKNNKSKVCCHCANNEVSSSGSSASSVSGWDWNMWARHFSEIEQAESYTSLLKFQLEDAIEREDFEEAVKLKSAITEATLKDCIAGIMSELKNAVDKELYHEASRLSQSTGSGLVGWWVGYSKDSDDPFGRIIHITPGVGRYIAKSYSPRQLVNAAPGTPLFEIFVVKDGNQSYTMQVVFLQRVKNPANPSLSADFKSTKGPSAVEVENGSIDVEVSTSEAEKSDEKGLDFEEVAEEGIRSVVNFLKEKIPELKVRVMNINVKEDVTEDADVKQLMEDHNDNASSSESSDEGASDTDDVQPDVVDSGEDNDSDEDEKDLDAKLFIGGVLHNKEDNSTKDEYVRVPAEIREMKKDSFVLHIPNNHKDNDMEELSAPNSRLVQMATKDVAKLMPPDVAKAFWSSDNVSPKISRDVREIIKLAVNQAQKRSRLSEVTNFSRITTSKGDLDPFDGLYVGSFGPYGTEVVQLRRKYGNWNANNVGNTSDIEFFEYVEAVKLTGDLNVPAGQVTFRAKIGKASRVSSRGIYPDELGVVSSYKGQGRIAESGFRNAKWVEGELLQLNGKGMGPYIKGADLGFLYVVPDQSFLVLFSRLKLPG